MFGNGCSIGVSVRGLSSKVGCLSFLPLSFAVDEDKAEIGDDSVDDTDDNERTVGI